MKKVLWAFAIFFIAALIFFGYAHSALAEETPSPTPLEPPSWLVDETFDPDITLPPSATAVPQEGGSGQRVTQDDLNQTHIYSLALSAYYAGSLNNRTVSYRYLQGQGQGASLWPVRNRANKLFLNTDEDGDPQDFSSVSELSVGSGSWYNSSAVNAKNGLYLMGFNDYPDYQLNRGYSIRYSIASSGLSPSFGAVSNYPAAFAPLGIDDTWLYNNLYVTIQVEVFYTDGNSFSYSVDTFPWIQFVSGYDFVVEFDNNDHTAYVDHVSVLVIINPSFKLSLVSLLDSYYESIGTAVSDRVYGVWYLGSTGYMTLSRMVNMSDTEHEHNWWQNFLINAFVPDPEVLGQVIEDFDFSADSGVASFALSLRDLIDDSFHSAVQRDFIIEFPAFNPNIGGVQYHFWDAHQISVAQVMGIGLSGSGWTLGRLFNLVFDFLFVSAFANSMLALFVGFYDLHLWNGVSGGGEED